MNHEQMTDSINSTFTALQAALGEQLSVLRMEIGCAAEGDQLERRDRLTGKAKKLGKVNDLVFQALQGYVEFTREGSHGTMPAPVGNEPVPQADDGGTTPVPGPSRRGLDVHFGGNHYQGRATRVFIDVLRDIGVVRIKELGLRVGDHQLVASKESPKNKNNYPRQQPIDGCWVMTTLSTPQMESILKEICRKLDLPIEVKVIPPRVITLDELIDSLPPASQPDLSL